VPDGDEPVGRSRIARRASGGSTPTALVRGPRKAARAGSATAPGQGSSGKHRHDIELQGRFWPLNAALKLAHVCGRC